MLKKIWINKKKIHTKYEMLYKLLQNKTNIWCHLIVRRWNCFCSDNPKPSTRSEKTHTKRIFPNDVNNGNKFDTKYLFTVYIKEIQYFRFVTNTFCASRKLTVFLLFENKPEKKFEWTKILPTMRKKKWFEIKINKIKEKRFKKWPIILKALLIKENVN